MIGFQCSTTMPCLGRTIFPSSPAAGSHPGVNGNGSASNGNTVVISNGTGHGGPFHNNRVPLTAGPSLIDYFHLNGDGLRLSWAHAVNSRAKLMAAIRGDDLMIEADVSLAETSRYPVPIMAHPPNNTSDLTLEDFLIEIIRSNCDKGIKFDFKSTRVVEPAFRVLARNFDFIRGPVVLNADIVAGPNNPDTSPVDAWTFLMLCRTRFPKAIISIGWTSSSSTGINSHGSNGTNNNNNNNNNNNVIDVGPVLKTGYTREMVDHMASLVREYNLMQPLTFSVNATLLKYSLCEMQALLFQFPTCTLTVWAHPEEFAANKLTLHDLLVIRDAFTLDSVFYDMPAEVLNELRRASNL